MPSQPHIILIMTDQQRTDAVEAWGHDHVITPNINRLAAEGVSFRQAYCPGATCIASRAATFTGQYAHNTGVFSFDDWAHQRNWVQDLADAGYWCVNIGKMHFSPRNAAGGFDERIIVENPTSKFHKQGHGDDNWGYFLHLNDIERPQDRQRTDPDWLKKYQSVPWHHDEEFHSDVFIGQSAVGWIKHHPGNKPLFLQIGFTGSHEPWDPLPRHLDLYQDKTMPEPVGRTNELADKPDQHQAYLDYFANYTQHEAQIDLRGASDEDIATMKRHYYAKVTTVDEQIGQVMTALEENGYLDNALVIFCSDHGELLGDHGLPYKWLMYDPIVNVPLIVRHPNGAQAGTQISDLVSLIDLGPTILEYAGVDIPSYFEGRSLLPYVQAGTAPHPREFVFCEDGYEVMIRSQTHKLVYYIGQDEGELYDLTSDPDELWNLWDQPDHEATKNSLLANLLRWLSSSVYHTAGYKQGRRHYAMRWPDADYHGLIGPFEPKPSKNLG